TVSSGCALCVLPTLEGASGLPALEAMGGGASVVAGNRAAIPEVVAQAAILVDPEDVPAMSEAMAEVLTVSHLRETLRQRGLARAVEFSSERTSGRLLALLCEVCRA